MKYTIAHFFCGIGGKGLGAAAAIARIGEVEATFETIGGIDFDPLACRDFEMLVGAPALCADVHELEPADLLRFLGPIAPDVIMLSPPCKGFSGLLSAKRAKEDKYQRMNALMERALFLIVSTWPTPPKLIFVENVPRIMSRGKETIRRCLAMGQAHGYAVVQGAHDCGELGGLEPGDIALAAWGVHVRRGRADRIAEIARAARIPLSCLGVTQNGSPKHPLYLAATAPLEPYGGLT